MRGLHAARDIEEGEIILCVPDDYVLTLDYVKNTPIGKKMIEKDIISKLYFPNHSLFAVYVMYEWKKPEEE